VKSRCGIVVLIVAVAVVVFATFAPSSLASTQLNTYEQQLVKAINQTRAKNHLCRLRVHPNLVASARAHSADMGENNYFEHDSLDGTSFAVRIMAHGYRRGGYRVWRAGECIGWGAGLYSSPLVIVQQWMDSPAHRVVILNRTLRDIGVGAVSTYGFGAADGMSWLFTMDAGVRVK
jgi:uncharacterized protein YkwD